MRPRDALRSGARRLAVARMVQSWLTGPRTLDLRETAIPEPGPGELVVRVEIALTCGTDSARPAGCAGRDAAFREPLSCVVNGVGRLDLPRAESAVVLGLGPIGLLFVALLKRKGVPSVLAVGRHKTRLETAKMLGAQV